MVLATRRRVLATGGLTGVGLLAYGGTRFFGGFQELAVAPVYTKDGLALGGTDPVAYFTEARPVSGLAEVSAEWNGATWQFANDENRAAFLAEPSEYAPQYGGFCAWAVAAKGKLYSTEPRNWSIVEGKLYLNFNDDIQRRWNADIAGFIARGDARWPGILAAA